MDSARFWIAVPADSELEARIAAAIAAQGDPPITIARTATTVLALEAQTADLMLRSRVVQALEAAVGPDWQRVVRCFE